MPSDASVSKSRTPLDRSPNKGLIGQGKLYHPASAADIESRRASHARAVHHSRIRTPNLIPALRAKPVSFATDDTAKALKARPNRVAMVVRPWKAMTSEARPKSSRRLRVRFPAPVKAAQPLAETSESLYINA